LIENRWLDSSIGKGVVKRRREEEEEEEEEEGKVVCLKCFKQCALIKNLNIYENFGDILKHKIDLLECRLLNVLSTHTL
jgi:hypothetical protein